MTTEDLKNQTIKSLEKMYKDLCKTPGAILKPAHQRIITEFSTLVQHNLDIPTELCVKVIQICGEMKLVAEQKKVKHIKNYRRKVKSKK